MINSPANYTIDLDRGQFMVANGSRPSAQHAYPLELGIQHLCGWGWCHGGIHPSVNNAYVVVPAIAPISFRIHVKPFARGLEVWLLAGGTDDTRIAVEISANTTAPAQLGTAVTTYINGTGQAIPADCQWTSVTITDMENGSADTVQYVDVKLDTDDNLRLFACLARQTHNTVLNQ